MESKEVLNIDSISYEVNNKSILSDISFKVNQGEMACIIGPNGSGKSTLIKLISGELIPTTGKVVYLNKEIKNWDITELACRRSILSQSNNLSFPFTIKDIIKMGRYPIKNSTKENDEKIYEILIEILDLKDKVDQNYITLSGGEKQRVQLARVFSQIWSFGNFSKKLLIIDEPTSFLDIKHQYALFDFLEKMNKKGLTIVMVLHDLNHALSFSNKIIMIKESRLLAEGKTSNVIDEEKLNELFDVKLKIVQENKKKSFISYK